MRWLLPRDDAFFVLFERSAATMVAGAEALYDLFSGAITPERFQPLDDIEHQGDALTQEVIHKLSRTFVTPMDRDDIHRLMPRKRLVNWLCSAGWSGRPRKHVRCAGCWWISAGKSLHWRRSCGVAA